MPFKKGETSNPKGNNGSRQVSITTEIKRELLKIPRGQRKTKLSQLVKIIFDKALKDHDNKMIERIWSYIDGLPRQQTDIKLDTEVNINLMNYGVPLLEDPKQVIQVIEDKGSID